MYRPLALLLLAPLAAEAARAQSSPVPGAHPLPYFAQPRASGYGFGSALTTPVQQALSGNPAALPAVRAVAVGGRAGTEARLKDEVVRTVDGEPDQPDQRLPTYLDAAVAHTPSEAGAVWAQGPFRIAAGYARTMDGRHRTVYSRTDLNGRPLPPGSGMFASRAEHAGVAASYALRLAPGVTVHPGLRVARTRVSFEEQFDYDGPGPGFYRTASRSEGVVWAAGLVVEGAALPVRVGLSYEASATLDGTGSRRCNPPEPMLCTVAERSYATDGGVPDRLEASVGAAYGPWSGEVTLARVRWYASFNEDVDTFLDVGLEGGANVRYAALPGVALTLGVHQTDRTPFTEDVSYGGESFDPFDQDPTRFLLAGLAVTHGPFVFDASYVNGSLLSDRGSRQHLGSLGVSVRF